MVHGLGGLWMQRAGVESILGLRIRGGFLHLDPCIPKSWATFEMTIYRQGVAVIGEELNSDPAKHGFEVEGRERNLAGTHFASAQRSEAVNS